MKPWISMELLQISYFQTSIFTALVFALLANCVAWAFDPIQWVKNRLMPFESWAMAESIGKKIIYKLLNCAPCLSWWMTLAYFAFSAVLSDSPIHWIQYTIEAIITALCAYCMASLIQKAQELR